MKLKIDVMLNAHASYNDLNGTAQLAWDIDEHTALNKVALKCGIDATKYQPIGIGLSISDHHFGLILYLAGTKTNEVGKRIVKSVLTEMEREEFFSLVKDLQITLFNPFEKHDELYEYTGEESLENL